MSKASETIMDKSASIDDVADATLDILKRAQKDPSSVSPEDQQAVMALQADPERLQQVQEAIVAKEKGMAASGQAVEAEAGEAAEQGQFSALAARLAIPTAMLTGGVLAANHFFFTPDGQESWFDKGWDGISGGFNTAKEAVTNRLGWGAEGQSFEGWLNDEWAGDNPLADVQKEYAEWAGSDDYQKWVNGEVGANVPENLEAYHNLKQLYDGETAHVEAALEAQGIPVNQGTVANYVEEQFQAMGLTDFDLEALHSIGTAADATEGLMQDLGELAVSHGVKPENVDDFYESLMTNGALVDADGGVSFAEGTIEAAAQAAGLSGDQLDSFVANFPSSVEEIISMADLRTMAENYADVGEAATDVFQNADNFIPLDTPAEAMKSVFEQMPTALGLE